jgi:hypothetical protein
MPARNDIRLGLVRSCPDVAHVPRGRPRSIVGLPARVIDRRPRGRHTSSGFSGSRRRGALRSAYNLQGCRIVRGAFGVRRRVEKGAVVGCGAEHDQREMRGTNPAATTDQREMRGTNPAAATDQREMRGTNPAAATDQREMRGTNPAAATDQREMRERTQAGPSRNAPNEPNFGGIGRSVPSLWKKGRGVVSEKCAERTQSGRQGWLARRLTLPGHDSRRTSAGVSGQSRQRRRTVQSWSRSLLTTGPYSELARRVRLGIPLGRG